MHIFGRILFIVLFLVFASPPASSQDQKEPKGSGTVSGRVSVDGRAAAGVSVVLSSVKTDPGQRVQEMLGGSSPLKTTTDQDGNFRIEVPAGRYEVAPFSPALIDSESRSPEDGKEVTVSEGQNVEGINFTLIRGGVITGRVTDASGRPIVREIIALSGADDSPSSRPMISRDFMGMIFTDDRGVYRIYGLPPGRYVVSAGNEGEVPGLAFLTGSRARPRTFHPGATDRARAKVVEVIAGAEATGVDIRIGPATKGYQASGRVIDGDTGKPIQNTIVAYTRTKEGGSTGEMPGGISPSGAKGEFHFDNVSPGLYKATAQFLEQESDYYGESISFEVKSEDVTGLEIKLHRGSSISGVAVVEDAADAEILSKLPLMYLSASVVGDNGGITVAGFGRGKIQPDGSFRIWGLRPGKAQIHVNSYLSAQKLKLIRVELDGVEVRDGIEIKAGEQITDVRLVLGAATGVISGQVVIEGGSLPAGTQLAVRAENKGDEDSETDGFAAVDATGRFVIEGLTPGTYEVTLMAEPSRDSQPIQLPKVAETVTVVKGAPSEVTLRLNLKKD